MGSISDQAQIGVNFSKYASGGTLGRNHGSLGGLFSQNKVTYDEVGFWGEEFDSQVVEGVNGWRVNGSTGIPLSPEGYAIVGVYETDPPPGQQAYLWITLPTHRCFDNHWHSLKLRIRLINPINTFDFGMGWLEYGNFALFIDPQNLLWAGYAAAFLDIDQYATPLGVTIQLNQWYEMEIRREWSGPDVELDKFAKVRYVFLLDDVPLFDWVIIDLHPHVEDPPPNPPWDFVQRGDSTEFQVWAGNFFNPILSHVDWIEYQLHVGTMPPAPIPPPTHARSERWIIPGVARPFMRSQIGLTNLKTWRAGVALTNKPIVVPTTVTNRDSVPGVARPFMRSKKPGTIDRAWRASTGNTK